MSIAVLALATGASAQAVKLDAITTFASPGADGDNGLPDEAAQGPDGAFYAISTFSPNRTVAFFRIDPVTHSHVVAARLDLGQTSPGSSRLVLAPNGRFYASFLADQGGGIVAFDPATNTAEVVRPFLIDPDTGLPGVDGIYPGALALGRDGWLYGAMMLSSMDDDPGESGTLFRFNPATGAFVTLHLFHFDEGGVYPFGALAQGADGVMYGTNLDVDTFCGNAFKFDPDTLAVTPLHTFDIDAEGCSPGALGVLPSGLLIGVTFSGNFDPSDPNSTTGGVFTLDPASGVVTPLHMFLASDPFTPVIPGNVTVASDGSAYVLTQNVTAGIASILRLHPETGAVQVIHDLMGPTPEIGALTIGRDARLYGIFASSQFFALGVLDQILVLPAGGTHGGTTTLSATLNALSVPLAGHTIGFTLNDTAIGSAVTDAAGVARLDNVSLAGVPSGTFPNGIGASFAGDVLFPATGGTGLLSVLAGATPGMMAGDGYIAEGLVRYDFKFVVNEKADGTDRGKLDVGVSDVVDNHRKKPKRNDRFVSTSYADVVFDVDPASPPQFDNVAFAGTGTWNGQAGYRVEALAQDHMGPGLHRESFKLTIYDAANHVVASVDGIVRGGSLESRRIHRK
jgi:hypothetical protein